MEIRNFGPNCDIMSGKYSKIHILAVIAAVTTLLADGGCSADGGDALSGSDRELLADILTDAPDNPYAHTFPAPEDGFERFRVVMPGSLRTIFNDSNHVQLEAARAIGISPIRNDADIRRLSRDLVRVESCPEYYLDRLTHSYAYLVPEAAQLLDDIGRAFNDSLAARGGGSYRIKVTSVLRTPQTVERLRRVNTNATGESTHSYGTTFDISYSKFVYDGQGGPARDFEDLKNLLASVLKAMRAEGRCYVKFEARQSCFHITVRPRQ